MNVVLDNIFSRRSVRSFTGESIPEESLETLIRSGMAAPSAMNIQPWEFIIVTERPLLNALQAGLPYAQMLEQAGTAIVVCGVPDKKPPYSTKYWTVDCAAATQNILLAAHALGLGAVWTAVYPGEEKIEAVQKALNMPPSIIPLSVIPIGVPANEGQAMDKFDAQKIHREQF